MPEEKKKKKQPAPPTGGKPAATTVDLTDTPQGKAEEAGERAGKHTAPDRSASDRSADGGMEIPEILPIYPLKEIVAFPFMMFPLVVNDPELVALADDALTGNKMLGLFTEPPEMVERGAAARPAPEMHAGWPVYPIGTAAVIHKMLRLPDGAMRLLVQGIGRVRLDDLTQREPFLRGKVHALHDTQRSNLTLEAIKRNVTELFNRVVEGSSTLPEELKMVAVNIEEPGRLADFVAANLNISLPTKQFMLQTLDVSRRLEMATGHLMYELNLQDMHKKIQSEVRSEIDKSQRDYILRQQIKAIQKELGEGEDAPTELTELEEKLKAANLPEVVFDAAGKELERLKRMSPQSAEYTVARSYIDWILQVPWTAPKRKPIDIARAERVLNEDHYDLERVKERILEYLAVRRLKESPRAPILCLVGPPGVGKTSLGRSIARALDRSFARLSLGGVHDEAEIRGHRRTYVGALPGRIVTGLVAAGAADPSSSWTRSTRWGRASAAIRPRRCSRCSIRSRTAPSAITT